jgi:thiol:disulfide interchange protein
MAILIGLLIAAFGALIWVLDWSMSRAEASTIGVILIVLGAMVMLASRLISERSAMERVMAEEQAEHWPTEVGTEKAPENDARPWRARPP